MQVNLIKMAELQGESKKKSQIQDFLERTLQFSEERKILKKVLNFNSTFVILLEDKGELKGLATLTPAVKDFFGLKATGLPIWRLRFCAQGEIFESLQSIAHYDLSSDYLEENCNLNLLVEILESIKNSSLQVGAVIAERRRNNLDKNSCLLVKSLGKMVKEKKKTSSYQEFNHYNAVFV